MLALDLRVAIISSKNNLITAMPTELHALDQQLPESLKKYQEIVTLVNKFNALQPRCRKLLDDLFLLVGQFLG